VPKGQPRRPLEMRYITRKGELDGTQWRVQIKRSAEMRTYIKCFADSQYGGKEKSLLAAQVWRDEMERAHPRLSKEEAITRQRKYRTSGKFGVMRRTLHERLGDGSTVNFAVWIAILPVGMKKSALHRSRSFAIREYGEEEAYRRAVAARKTYEEAAAPTEAGHRPLPGKKRQPSPPEMHNIFRLENSASHSWCASINRPVDGAQFRKTFCDLEFGGEAEALAAAQAWRDEMERLCPKLTLKERSARLRKDNTSGKTGVHRVLRMHVRSDGSEYFVGYWKAHLPTESSPRRSRSFSVEKHGEEEAYRLAVEARLALETKLSTSRR
jgi:hypothetical protein